MARLIRRRRLYLHTTRNRHAIRVYSDRKDPFDIYSDEEIYSRYRFTKDKIIELTDMLHNSLRHPTKRNKAFSPRLQVMTALRFYATGTIQMVIGDTVGGHKSTVSRIIHRVSKALVRLAPEFVKWPENDELPWVRQKFFEVAGFPYVVGAIDCTHVALQAPSAEEPAYVNRKQYHSINVQAVALPKRKFSNVVAKFPGSCHDSGIFRRTRIFGDLVLGTKEGIVLGDSAYPNNTFCVVPYRVCAPGSSEERYNLAHCKTRCLVEQSFGVIKRRFQCLHGELRLNPTRSCAVIVACFVLHNLAIDWKQPDNFEPVVNLIQQPPPQNDNGRPQDQVETIRRQITHTFFR